jgi:hypothetical protein
MEIPSNEILKQLPVAQKYLRKFFNYAIPSMLGRLSLILLFLIFLLSPILLLQTYLNFEDTKNFESQQRKREFIATELQHLYAIDEINLCMDSIREKSKLKDWYCKQAADAYRLASTYESSLIRVHLLIRKQAYGDMKNDLANQLRFKQSAKNFEENNKQKDFWHRIAFNETIFYWVLALTVLFTFVVMYLVDQANAKVLRVPHVDQ